MKHIHCDCTELAQQTAVCPWLAIARSPDRFLRHNNLLPQQQQHRSCIRARYTHAKCPICLRAGGMQPGYGSCTSAPPRHTLSLSLSLSLPPSLPPSLSPTPLQHTQSLCLLSCFHAPNENISSPATLLFSRRAMTARILSGRSGCGRTWPSACSCMRSSQTKAVPSGAGR